MEPSTINLLVTLGIIIMCLTIVHSLILMIGGNKLFKKASKDEKSAFIPVVNLFTLLDIVNMSTFFGILFFFPVINLFVLSLMSYKLGKVFNTTTSFTLGLIFLPIIFYPLLAYSDKPYKLSDEEYFKALDDAKVENMSLLMTEEELEKENNETTSDNVNNVDSIFKSDLELNKPAGKYHAENIKAVGFETLENADSPNPFEPIEREELPVIMEREEEVKEKKFTSELDKEEEVEIVDL